MTPNKTTCCEKCKRLRTHEDTSLERFVCSNPSCECHSGRELNIVDRVKSGAEISYSSMTNQDKSSSIKLEGEINKNQYLGDHPTNQDDYTGPVHRSDLEKTLAAIFLTIRIGSMTDNEFFRRIQSLLASERSRIRKLVEGMKKDKDPYYDGIYNQALSDVLELLN